MIFFFFFNDTATTEIYTLSLHDALPIHLALSLERLESLAGRRLTRVGLSATQKPVEEVARFLVGTRNLLADGAADCTIIDSGHVRERDLQLEIPASPLEAVMSGGGWEP